MSVLCLQKAKKSSLRAVLFFCRQKTDSVCDRLMTNLMFLNNMEKESDFWNRYMQIRYEDFALNPLGVSLKIYQFVGVNMTLKVKNWLNTATSVANRDKLAEDSPQGLIRNVKSVLNHWRKDLSFEAVQEIQSKCEKILNNLGYKIFDNYKDFKNLSTLYFEPNWSP